MSDIKSGSQSFGFEGSDSNEESFLYKYGNILMLGVVGLAVLLLIIFVIVPYFQGTSQSSSAPSVPDDTKIKGSIDAAIKKLTEIAQKYVDDRLASEKVLLDNTNAVKNSSAESDRLTKLSETDKDSAITIGNNVETSKQAVITAVNASNDATATAAATVSQANSDAAATTLVAAENAINDAKVLATSSLVTISGYLTTAQQSSLFVSNSLASATSALSYSQTALTEVTRLLEKVKTDAEGAPEYTTLTNAENDVKNFVLIIDDTIAITKSADTLKRLQDIKALAIQAVSDANNTLVRIRQIFGDGASTGTIRPQEAIDVLTQQVDILNSIVARIKLCVDTLKSISDGINSTIDFINISLVQTQTNIDKLIKMVQDLIAAANAAISVADAAATDSAAIFQQLGTYPTPTVASSLRKENFQYPSQRKRYGLY